MCACLPAKLAEAEAGSSLLSDNTEQVSRGSTCELQPSFGSMLRRSGVFMLGQ